MGGLDHALRGRGDVRSLAGGRLDHAAAWEASTMLCVGGGMCVAASYVANSSRVVLHRCAHVKCACVHVKELNLVGHLKQGWFCVFFYGISFTVGMCTSLRVAVCVVRHFPVFLESVRRLHPRHGSE